VSYALEPTPGRHTNHGYQWLDLFALHKVFPGLPKTKPLSAVKDKFAKGDYKAALGEAQGLVTKANDLVASAKTKKEELTKSWTTLSEGLPKMVGAIQSRVDILSKAKKLPANLTAEKFAEAKSGLEAATADWAKAQESFKSGNLGEAIALANTVKGKAVQAMEILGLPVPPAAK
jgi:hypothetical protein